MRVTRFANLRSAGRELAGALEQYARRDDTLVLGIVRGGIPVATEVARHLSLPLDVLLQRRLFDNVTAVYTAGTLVLPEQAAAREDPGAAEFLAEALRTFAERNTLCRGTRPAVDVRAMTVLLIDNGVHTGGTVRAAVQALRTLGPARIVLAVPVANPDTRTDLEARADEVVCLEWPCPFPHVGIWYADFDVPHVEQIHALLGAEAGLR